jgi:hypothetical protein
MHLLLGMKEQFIADEMDLNFDYIGFFDTCLTMLGDILAQCEPLIPAQLVPHEGIEKMYAPTYDIVYAILWDAADRSTSNDSLQQSLLFLVNATLEEVIEQRGDSCVKLARDKTCNLRRPAVAQADEADESKKTNGADDNDFVRKFFGTSTIDTRGPGIFCSCMAEVDARVNMRRLQVTAGHFPGQVSSKDLVDAACKVLAFALPGIPEGEREEVVNRLHRALGASQVGASAHIEPKDMLDAFVQRGLQQMGHGGDARSKDGTDGKDNAKP